MRAGEFPDGSRTLRAKIDMASPNLNMRDPGDVPHPARRRTTARATRGASIRCTTSPTASPTRSSGSPIRSARWSSRTTGRSTTGISTTLGIYHPQQIEFARLNLTYTVMSKRKLLELVEGEATSAAGTIRGCRRSAACAAAATRPRRSATFCERIGVAKFNSTIDIALLEHCVREDLNRTRAARDGRAAAAEGGHRELSRGPGRGAGRGQQPRGRRGRARARCRSRASCTSSRTTSAKTRRKKYLPPRPGPRGAAALRLLRHVHGRGQGRRAARSSSCTAPTTPRPAAATPRPTAAR